MKKLDSFFDTYEKRTLFVYLIYLLCTAFFALMHLLLGICLIQVNTYEQTFSLFNEWTVQNAFFGKCALNLLNMPVLDVIGYLMQTVGQMQLYEAVFFIGSLLCLFTKKRQQALCSLLCFALVFIIMIIIFLAAFSSGTLYGAIAYIRYIGILLAVVYFLLLLMLSGNIYFGFKDYREALKTEVVIIE